MRYIYVDFETSSKVNLKQAGAYRYAEDPSTEILCAVFTDQNNRHIKLFQNDLKNAPAPLLSCINDPECIFVAHNASFERTIWRHILSNKYQWPEIHVSRWVCTQALLYSFAFPTSLEAAGSYLFGADGKDMAGKELMLKVCKPNGLRDKDTMNRLMEYCVQDTIVTKKIHELFGNLTPTEQEVWELDQEINDRGIPVDLELVKRILKALEAEQESILEECKRLTGGAINSPTQRDKALKFLEENGLVLPDLRKNTVEDALATSLDNELLTRFLELRQAASKSSTAKYKRILDSVSSDGTIKGCYQYHGAHTGRWAGRGVQPQNFPRVSYIDIQSMRNASPLIWALVNGSAAKTASELLRSTITAPEGYTLGWGDFAGIEARVTAWLAGDTELCDRFRAGEDIYCIQAEKVYGRKITKKDKQERQLGKAIILAFGYQGGISAMFNACAAYRLSLSLIADQIIDLATEEELERAAFCVDQYMKATRDLRADQKFNRKEATAADIIKQKYRRGNVKIENLWAATERAVIMAVDPSSDRTSPASVYALKLFTAKGISFQVKKYGEHEFLEVLLPFKKRPLRYYQPKVTTRKNKFGKEKETFSASYFYKGYNEPIQEDFYGGKLVENFVQAIARDILVNKMLIQRGQYNIILTTHDEIGLLLPKEDEADMKAELCRIETYMDSGVDWAIGLPLAAEINMGKYYDK